MTTPRICIRKFAGRALVFGAMALSLTCCAARPLKQPAELDAARPYWWNAHFYIDWPVGSEPAWHLDAMLAKEVLAPVLFAERPNIALWRFHRRAVRDGSGHNFSFIFYAPADSARRLYSAIGQQPVLADLQRRRRVLRVALDDPAHPGSSAVEATSDTHWPLLLQRSWPHYIMGVSAMWLDLLDQLVAKRRSAIRDETLYHEVQDELTALWADWGQHAMLHHLSALFAYQPVLIDREIRVRF